MAEHHTASAEHIAAMLSISTWATTDEILATARCFNVDVLVCGPYWPRTTWHEHTSQQDGAPAICMDNSSAVHFDVVLSVAGNGTN